MKDPFPIPRKYFLSDPMRESLQRAPLVIADVGSAMGLDPRWHPVREYIKVISFEPDARSDGDGTVYRTALGNTPNEEKTLHLAELPAASSFYSHHPEMDRFVVRDWLKSAGETRVPVTTLDACLEGKPVDCLKIDVEGADLDVLQGAEETLQNVLAIQVEVSFAERHVDAPGFSEIDLHLRKRGFHFHSLSPEYWMRRNATFGSGSQPQLIWGDAVYLRDEMEEADLAKWAILLQAYGFQDYAIDKMPEPWAEVMKRSVRSHFAFFAMAGWRWFLATALLPFLGKRAWRKWKTVSAKILRELNRLARRCGPDHGILPDE